MCVSRLVMQDWHENFTIRLKASKIFEHLGGLYVDDGRNLLDVLPLGCRFVSETGTIEFSEIWDVINPDLKFTTEIEEEFETKLSNTFF